MTNESLYKPASEKALESASSCPRDRNLIPRRTHQEDEGKHSYHPCQGRIELIFKGGALRYQGKVRRFSETGCSVSIDGSFGLEAGSHLEAVLSINDRGMRVLVAATHINPGGDVELCFLGSSLRGTAEIKELASELAS